MKIVIDISKEEYQTYINHTVAILDKSTPLVHQDLLKAVINGTPLPEHYGDLIDRRELKKEVYTTTEWNGDIHRIIYEASIDDAPTIIERSDSE